MVALRKKDLFNNKHMCFNNLKKMAVGLQRVNYDYTLGLKGAKLGGG